MAGGGSVEVRNPMATAMTSFRGDEEEDHSNSNSSGNIVSSR